MAAITYMKKRGNTYHFRVRVPKSLAGRAAPAHVRAAFPRLVHQETGRFKLEVTGSLRTKDLRTAKERDLRKAAEVTEMFDGAERLLEAGPHEPVRPDLPPLADIEAGHIRELLELDDRERSSGDAKRGLQTEADREAIRRDHPGQLPAPARGLGELGPDFWMGEDHSFAYGDLLKEERDHYADAVKRSDFSVAEPAARTYFHRRGERYDRGREDHRDVARALLRATATATDLMLERQAGRNVPTPAALPPSQGPKLSEAFKHWREGSAARGGRKPSASSIREAELAVRLFQDWAGDKRLGAITKEDTRTFRGALERRPTRLTKKLKDLPLRRLLDEDLSAYPPVHADTVNKHLTLLSTIVSTTLRDGLAEGLASFVNPFEGVKVAVDRRHTGERTSFDAADLAAIFGTPVYAARERPRGGKGEAAFWLPVLGLLTGARLEELAQLRVCDLRKDTEADVWFLDIGTSGGRSVKTASSRRRVPLHPALVTIGLLDYREVRAKAGPDATLWPDLTSSIDGKRSAGWSKWFGRYRRGAAGVAGKETPFHSFRHTFKRLCRDAGLTEEMHDALTGHAGGGGVGRGYGRGFGLKALAEGIAKIAAPAAVSDLRWGPKPGHGGKLADDLAGGTPGSDG